MSADLARLQIFLEANVTQLERQMKKGDAQVRASLDSMQKKMERFEVASTQSANKIGLAFSRSLSGNVAAAASTLAASLSVEQIAAASDLWTNLGNRLQSFGMNAEQAAAAQQSLVGIAERSRTDISAVIDLYSRLTFATKNLGLAQSDVAVVTETITKALKMSGATSQEAASAALQLGQALASGRLQGDELRSLLENAPMLAEFIAKEFNVSVGQIKQLGAEGRLTSDKIVSALMRASGEIESGFAKTKKTWADTLTELKNGFVEFVGSVQSAISESETFVAAAEDAQRRLKAARDASGLTSEDEAKAAAAASAASRNAIEADQASAQAQIERTRMTLAALISDLSKMGSMGLSKSDTAQAVEVLQSGLEGNAQAAFDASVALEKLSRSNLNYQDLADRFNPLLQKLGELKIAAENAQSALNITVSVPSYAPPKFLGGADRAGDAAAVATQNEIAKRILDDELVNARLSEGAQKIKSKVNELRAKLLESGSSASESDLKKYANSILSAEQSASGLSQFDQQIQKLKERADAIRLEGQSVGLSTYEIEKNKAAQELLNAAKENHIAITAKLRGEIDASASSYAQAVVTTDELKRAQEDVAAMKQEFGSAISGFFSDMASGGKNAQDALMNLTKRVAEFAMQWALLGRNGNGGLLGMMFNSLPNFFGGGTPSLYPTSSAAEVKFANGTNFAPGGMALTGENGPEFINIPRGSEVTPAPLTRKLMAQQSGPTVIINQTFTADSNPRELAQIANQIREQTKASVFESLSRGQLSSRR